MVVIKGPGVDHTTGNSEVCACVRQIWWVIIFALVQNFLSCVDQQAQKLVNTKQLAGQRRKTTSALLFVIIYYYIITLWLGVGFLQ